MKFCTHWNPSWLKKYTANCLSYVTVNLYLSFLFHNNNSVYTIFTWKNWITIPASFRNGEILYSTLALNFKDWPFGIIVTRHFRPKSGHLNDRVYCKPIEQLTLKNVTQWEVGQLSMTNHSWVMEVTGFWVKKIDIWWF